MRTLSIGVGPYRPSGSGMATFARNLVNCLAHAGHKVTIFGHETTALRARLKDRVTIIDFGPDPVWLDPLGPQVAYGHIRSEISRMLNLREVDWDLLHAPWPTARFPRIEVPIVVSGWSFGSVLEMAGHGARSFKGFMRAVGAFGHVAYYSADRNGYLAADLSIFTTRAGADYWGRKGVRASYIPCPIEAPITELESTKAADGERIRFLIGERDLDRPRNNVGRFLLGARSLPPNLTRKFEITLVGKTSGSLSQAIRKTQEAGVPVSKFDYLPAPAFYRLLSKADVCVLLRDILDHGGYLGLEAMSMGKALLVSNSKGFSDFVFDGQNGLIIDSHSTSDISKGISLLLDDRKLTNQMGERSTTIAARLHSYQHVAEALGNSYDQILQDYFPQRRSKSNS